MQTPVTPSRLSRAWKSLLWRDGWTSRFLYWLSGFRIVAWACGSGLYSCRLSTAFDDIPGGFFKMEPAEQLRRMSDPTRNFFSLTNDLRRAVEWCQIGVREHPLGTLATIAYFDLRCLGPDGTRASHIWRTESGIQLSEGLELRLGLPITPRGSQIIERNDQP